MRPIHERTGGAGKRVESDGRRADRDRRDQRGSGRPGQARQQSAHRRRFGVAPPTAVSIDLPLRATGDADFGLTPYLLRDPELVEAIEERGYRKVLGNRWERPIDDTRIASVDLLIAGYRTRTRDTVRVGDVVTTEVPGLAEALRRPGVDVDVDILLTDRSPINATVLIPDAASMLGLKAWARTVRQESRDAEDLWRCLEIALADGVDRQMLDADPTLGLITRSFSASSAPGVRRSTRSRPVRTRTNAPDAAPGSERSSPWWGASLTSLDEKRCTVGASTLDGINSSILDPAVEFALVEANNFPISR